MAGVLSSIPSCYSAAALKRDSRANEKRFPRFLKDDNSQWMNVEGSAHPIHSKSWKEPSLPKVNQQGISSTRSTTASSLLRQVVDDDTLESSFATSSQPSSMMILSNPPLPHQANHRAHPHAAILQDATLHRTPLHASQEATTAAGTVTATPSGVDYAHFDDEDADQAAAWAIHIFLILFSLLLCISL
eukprot:scaffold24228_cov255-Cylindrotheca_fusiformis.AAC.1